MVILWVLARLRPAAAKFTGHALAFYVVVLGVFRFGYYQVGVGVEGFAVHLHLVHGILPVYGHRLHLPGQLPGAFEALRAVMG